MSARIRGAEINAATPFFNIDEWHLKTESNQEHPEQRPLRPRIRGPTLSNPAWPQRLVALATKPGEKFASRGRLELLHDRVLQLGEIGPVGHLLQQTQGLIEESSIPFRPG